MLNQQDRKCCVCVLFFEDESKVIVVSELKDGSNAHLFYVYKKVKFLKEREREFVRLCKLIDI